MSFNSSKKKIITFTEMNMNSNSIKNFIESNENDPFAKFISLYFE